MSWFCKSCNRTKSRGRWGCIKNQCYYLATWDSWTHNSCIECPRHVLHCVATKGILNHCLGLMWNIASHLNKIDTILGQPLSIHYIVICFESLNTIWPDPRSIFSIFGNALSDSLFANRWWSTLNRGWENLGYALKKKWRIWSSAGCLG